MSFDCTKEEVLKTLDDLKTGVFGYVDLYNYGQLVARVYDFNFYEIGDEGCYYEGDSKFHIKFDGTKTTIDFVRLKGGPKQ